MKKSNNTKPTIGDLIWNFLGKLLFPFCIVCLILTMFFNVFFLAKVPSGSMLNTIKIGDILLVKNSHFSKEIKRGDICVFKKTGEEFLLVKRVVGLPGEKTEQSTLMIKSSKKTTCLPSAVPMKSFMFRTTHTFS